MSVLQMPANASGKKNRASARRISVYNVTRDTVLASVAEVADRGATRRKGLLGRSGLRGVSRHVIDRYPPR